MHKNPIIHPQIEHYIMTQFLVDDRFEHNSDQQLTPY